jgi:hypothetical protein
MFYPLRCFINLWQHQDAFLHHSISLRIYRFTMLSLLNYYPFQIHNVCYFHKKSTELRLCFNVMLEIHSSSVSSFFFQQCFLLHTPCHIISTTCFLPALPYLFVTSLSKHSQIHISSRYLGFCQLWHPAPSVYKSALSFKINYVLITWLVNNILHFFKSFVRG